MSTLDPAVAHALDSTLDPNSNGTNGINNPNEDLDEDALLESLDTDTDPTLSHLRETRIQQLSHEIQKLKAARAATQQPLSTLTSEKDLLAITTNPESPRCVVHFFKSDFAKCTVMDGHLERLATLHFETRFLRISVEAAPFLVERLRIRVLPCVVGFVGGVERERVVGFEGLGFQEGGRFETGDLEGRLLASGVLVRRKIGEEGRGRVVWGKGKEERRARAREEDEDEGDDWD